MMKITGSIVTHNNSRTIYDCISGILKNTKDRDYDFRLYVYDNNSEDDTVSIIVKNFPEVTVICDEDNRGFGYGHNAIMKKVRSDVHMVINPDVVVDMDTIGILAKYISEHDEVGLVTPRVLNRDGSEQYLPKYCPTIRYTGMSKLPGFHYLRRRYTRQNEKNQSLRGLAFFSAAAETEPAEQHWQAECTDQHTWVNDLAVAAVTSLCVRLSGMGIAFQNLTVY